MFRAIGATRWAIAEGYIPPESHGLLPQMLSHETVCILNVSSQDAHIELTIFYSDRGPAGPYKEIVPACRTKHIRFNDLKEPEVIPLGKDYACLIESDVSVVVQHTRLDSRQAENALMTTIAYSSPS